MCMIHIGLLVLKPGSLSLDIVCSWIMPWYLGNLRSRIQFLGPQVKLSTEPVEIQWITYILDVLEIQHSNPTILFSNSQSAMAIAQNHVFHERIKHIEIDCHFVRKKLQQALLKLHHVPIAHQLADVFMKPRAPSTFHGFISKLGPYNMYTPACSPGGSTKATNSAQKS